MKKYVTVKKACVFTRDLHACSQLACFDFWPYNKKNITRYLEDMNIIFSCLKQYFTHSLRSFIKCCFHHSKITFISSRHRIISSMYNTFYEWKYKLSGKQQSEYSQILGRQMTKSLMTSFLLYVKNADKNHHVYYLINKILSQFTANMFTYTLTLNVTGIKSRAGTVADDSRDFSAGTQ